MLKAPVAVGDAVLAWSEDDSVPVLPGMAAPVRGVRGGARDDSDGEGGEREDDRSGGSYWAATVTALRDSDRGESYVDVRFADGSTALVRVADVQRQVPGTTVPMLPALMVGTRVLVAGAGDSVAGGTIADLPNGSTGACRVLEDASGIVVDHARSAVLAAEGEGFDAAGAVVCQGWPVLVQNIDGEDWQPAVVAGIAHSPALRAAPPAGAPRGKRGGRGGDGGSVIPFPTFSVMLESGRVVVDVPPTDVIFDAGGSAMLQPATLPVGTAVWYRAGGGAPGITPGAVVACDDGRLSVYPRLPGRSAERHAISPADVVVADFGCLGAPLCAQFGGAAGFGAGLHAACHPGEARFREASRPAPAPGAAVLARRPAVALPRPRAAVPPPPAGAAPLHRELRPKGPAVGRRVGDGIFRMAVGGGMALGGGGGGGGGGDGDGDGDGAARLLPARITAMAGVSPRSACHVEFCGEPGGADVLLQDVVVLGPGTREAAAWWPPIATETRVAGRADGTGSYRLGTVLGGGSDAGYLVAWDDGDMGDSVARLDLVVLTGAAAEAVCIGGSAVAVAGDVVRVAAADGTDAWALARVDAVRCDAAAGSCSTDPFALPPATVEVTFLDFSLDIDVDSARRLWRDPAAVLSAPEFEMLGIASLDHGGVVPPIFVPASRSAPAAAAGGGGGGGGSSAAPAAAAPAAGAAPPPPAPAARDNDGGGDDMDVDMDTD